MWLTVSEHFSSAHPEILCYVLDPVFLCFFFFLDNQPSKKQSHKGNCNMWCLHKYWKWNHFDKKNAKSSLSPCLVFLEVIINGVLQLPELFFLLHLFLFLVSSQSWFNIVFFIVIILLFLQRQKGQGAGGRGRSKRTVLRWGLCWTQNLGHQQSG